MKFSLKNAISLSVAVFFIFILGESEGVAWTELLSSCITFLVGLAFLALNWAFSPISSKKYFSWELEKKEFYNKTRIRHNALAHTSKQINVNLLNLNNYTSIRAATPPDLLDIQWKDLEDKDQFLIGYTGFDNKTLLFNDLPENLKNSKFSEETYQTIEKTGIINFKARIEIVDFELFDGNLQLTSTEKKEFLLREDRDLYKLFLISLKSENFENPTILFFVTKSSPAEMRDMAHKILTPSGKISLPSNDCEAYLNALLWIRYGDRYRMKPILGIAYLTQRIIFFLKQNLWKNHYSLKHLNLFLLSLQKKLKEILESPTKRLERLKRRLKQTSLESFWKSRGYSSILILFDFGLSLYRHYNGNNHFYKWIFCAELLFLSFPLYLLLKSATTALGKRLFLKNKPFVKIPQTIGFLDFKGLSLENVELCCRKPFSHNKRKFTPPKIDFCENCSNFCFDIYYRERLEKSSGGDNLPKYHLLIEKTRLEKIPWKIELQEITYERWIKSIDSDSPLTNLCLHLIILTRDNYLLISQKSKSMDNESGKLSLSLEEQLSSEDFLEEHGVRYCVSPRRWIKRALWEELGLEEEEKDYSLKNCRILSLFQESFESKSTKKIFNYSLCAYIQINLSKSSLSKKLIRGEAMDREISKISFISPYKIEKTFDLLEGELHSTSRYREKMFLSHFYGKNFFIER